MMGWTVDSLHRHEYHSKSAMATGEQNHYIATNTTANQYSLFTGLALTATAMRQLLTLFAQFHWHIEFGIISIIVIRLKN
jgi:hypothetical protein